MSRATEMQERIDIAIVDWAKRIPIDLVPAVLELLAARLITEGMARRNCDPDLDGAAASEKLLTAAEIAKYLNARESWVRNEERLGRLPGVRLGKYVRFRRSEIERKLAEQNRQ